MALILDDHRPYVNACNNISICDGKEKKAKPVDLTPDTMTEEEALKAELLEATEDHATKLCGTDDASSKKVVPEKTSNHIAPQPKK